MATRTILLDVGGTFIKCSDGRTIAIDSGGSREEIQASLREAVGDYDKAAVAIPGPFRYNDGTFMMQHKFASVYGERFADLVGKACEYSFIHDVNCMLRGEMLAGEAVGFSRVALVSLGTGLGFTMAVDGKILENEMGSPAVSIFKLPYKDGILEDYASKRGFLRGYEGITVKDLAEMAKNGDVYAINRFNEVGDILGNAIKGILMEYGIECLLFGGQISRSAELFIPALKEALKDIGTVRKICVISSIDNATFNGLNTLV